MAASLPPVPRIIFTILEPISLVAGCVGAFYDPVWFVTQQIPHDEALAVSENGIVVAQQLGNMYLGMCFIGLAVLYTTTETRVVRNYVVALLLADIGHIFFTCYGMGKERFVNPSGWNAMAWGNIGATLFLFGTRVAYLAGLLGADRHVVAAAKKTN